MDKGLLRQFEKQAQAYQVKNMAFVIWIQTVWRYDSYSWHNFFDPYLHSELSQWIRGISERV